MARYSIRDLNGNELKSAGNPADAMIAALLILKDMPNQHQDRDNIKVHDSECDCDVQPHELFEAIPARELPRVERAVNGRTH